MIYDDTMSAGEEDQHPTPSGESTPPPPPPPKEDVPPIPTMQALVAGGGMQDTETRDVRGGTDSDSAADDG